MQIQNNKTKKSNFHAMVVPMFMKVKTDTNMADATQDNKDKKDAQEISVFDVKELYDLAYTKHSDSEEFKSIMTEAIKMDMAYRRQLTENNAYKGPFGTYNDHNAKKAGNAA